ncbi:MAG: hypothetical protein GY861_01070 [bacterium]|nr:hypothetical protein [bacterium]
MATTMNFTEINSALKEMYPQNVIEDVSLKDRPLLAMLAKKPDLGGDSWKQPLRFGRPQGRSATFTNAQSNAYASKLSDFQITVADDFGVCYIEDKAIKASKGKEKAFLEAKQMEIDGLINTLMDSACQALYGTGSGSIGQILNTGAGAGAGELGHAVLRLVNPEDVVNFEVGQVIVADSVDGGGTVHSGSLSVSSVDRMTGYVTMSGTLDTWSGAAQNDYLFVQGDYDGKMSGLQAWMPYMNSAGSSIRATKLAASFFGVTRTTDEIRQGGCYHDGSGVPIEEAFIDAEKIVTIHGGKLSHIFMHPSKLANLKKSLGSKVEIADIVITPTISFKGVVLYGMKGQTVLCVADPFCPSKMAFGVQMDTWYVGSMGAIPHFLEEDGLVMLRGASTTAYEVRMLYYGQLVGSAPGWNVNIYLG